MDNTTTKTRAFSKWWIVGVLIAWILFYIIGGALLGTACSTGYDYYYGYEVSCNIAQAQGGYAMVAIASLLFVAMIILLVIYLVKRKNTVFVNNNDTAAHSQPVQMETQAAKHDTPAPAPTHQPEAMSPAPTYTTTPQYQAPAAQGHELNASGKTCMKCEMMNVQSPFCPRCGNQV